jgi:hypothetical protein
VEDLGDLVPVLFVGGAFLGENDHSLVVFEPAEEDLDLVADLEVLDVVELGKRNDALALVADIDEDFARAELEDVTFDDTTLAKVPSGILGEQFLHC